MFNASAQSRHNLRGSAHKKTLAPEGPTPPARGTSCTSQRGFGQGTSGQGTGTVHLEAKRSKNAEGRTFPFASLPPLVQLLEDQRQRTRAVERELGRIVPHVFHRDGEPIRSMRRAWDSACGRAGIPGAWFHLRRTAVMHLERAGVPRSVAMKLTGHKTEAVYRRYAIADAASLAEGVEKLARLHASPQEESPKVSSLRS